MSKSDWDRCCYYGFRCVSERTRTYAISAAHCEAELADAVRKRSEKTVAHMEEEEGGVPALALGERRTMDRETVPSVATLITGEANPREIVWALTPRWCFAYRGSFCYRPSVLSNMHTSSFPSIHRISVD